MWATVQLLFEGSSTVTTANLDYLPSYDLFLVDFLDNRTIGFILVT